MITASILRQAIEARGIVVRGGGRGWTRVRCPGHDDRHASFGYKENPDGSVSMRCHASAGCTREHILGVLGLVEDGDYAPSPLVLIGGVRRAGSEKPKPAPTVERKPGLPCVMPIPDGLEPPASKLKIRGQAARVWWYRDEDGRRLLAALRWDLPDGKGKIYSHLTLHRHQRGYVWDRGGEGSVRDGLPEPRPLYGLDRLRGADKVMIVEGEKAADAVLEKLPGWRGISWMGGAQAWERADWSPVIARRVAGVDVRVWPDNDETGREAALGVSRLVGCPVVDVPASMPKKGWDLADDPGGVDLLDVLAGKVDTEADLYRDALATVLEYSFRGFRDRVLAWCPQASPWAVGINWPRETVRAAFIATAMGPDRWAEKWLGKKPGKKARR